jgi:hypothetical protein
MLISRQKGPVNFTGYRPSIPGMIVRDFFSPNRAAIAFEQALRAENVGTDF